MQAEENRTERIFLLDHDEFQILGSKLPSNVQVLRVLLYNMRKVKLNFRASATLVVKEVEVQWRKARIPTKKMQHSVEKLEALYNEWKTLQKSSKRRTQLQEQREQEFLDKFDDLFDIAHADALQLMNKEQDKLFLENQRKKGRPGKMISYKLYEKEREVEMQQQQEEPKRTHYEANIDGNEKTEASSFTENETKIGNDENVKFKDLVDLPGPSKPKRRRTRK